MNGFVLAALVAALLWRSGAAMQAARVAASVFVSGVMPALFPMMVLCRLIRPAKKAERSSARVWAGAALFAFSAGSPASAQRARALLDEGRVGNARALAALTGVMSPMFFVGTLADWTGLTAGAWVMLMCHWAGAALTAGLCALGKKIHASPPPVASHATDETPAAMLANAVSASCSALLAVLGAMMLFSIAAALLRELCTMLLPGWTQKNARAMAIAWAVMEVGGGARAVLDAFAAPPLPLLCALCSFGGLSIWLQNLMFLASCVRPGPLLGLRALHAAISFLLCHGALMLLPQAAQAFAAPVHAAAQVATPLWPLGLVMLGAAYRRAF